MAYRLGGGIWREVFAVPTAVVDEHLKIASGLAVKVLLLLLRHGEELEIEEISRATGQSAADVQDALNFWIASGVLLPGEEPAQTAPAHPPVELRYTEVFDEPELGQAPKLEPERDCDEERRVRTLSSGRRRLSTQEINEMAREDENVGYLLQEAQAVLGKTLTPVSTETVTALYSYHGMQPDLILMLMHYCASIGKDSMRYIEKVAADWMDKGIDTHEKAEAEILRLTKERSVEGKIKKAFGIYDRNLVPSEKKYIHAWVDEFRMEMPLITLAYERAVELKGKLSFPYINGILSNWHAKGITTTAQAMQEIRENRQKPQQAAKEGSSYDMAELERMITYGDIV